MRHKRPRSTAGDSSASDSDLVAHLQDLTEICRKPGSGPDTVPCLAPPSVTNRDRSHVHGEAECHKYEEVEWLQFMAPEIQQAQHMFRDRRLLINTMCPTNHITSPAGCQQLRQAMKIPFSETVSSDLKISAMHFRAGLARLGLVPQATHHFLDVMDLVRGSTFAIITKQCASQRFAGPEGRAQ